MRIRYEPRPIVPGRCEPVCDVRVERRSLLIRRERTGSVFRGQEPVPVQGRHVLGVPRSRMPAEQVVVVVADFAGRIVVANVVEVGLRQRSMDEAEDQENDPQATLSSLLSPTSDRHKASPRSIRTCRGESQDFP